MWAPSETFRAILVCLGFYNKVPQTGRLKQQKCMSHSSGNWLAKGQGVSRLFLMKGHFLPGLTFHWHEDMGQERGGKEEGGESKVSDVSFSKDTNPIGSGTHPYDLI